VTFLQRAVSHKPGNTLLLLSTRLVITFPSAEHHSRLVITKLYCLVVETYLWTTCSEPLC